MSHIIYSLLGSLLHLHLFIIVECGASGSCICPSAAEHCGSICLTCVAGILIGLQMDSRIGLTLARLRNIHEDRVICF